MYKIAPSLLFVGLPVSCVRRWGNIASIGQHRQENMIWDEAPPIKSDSISQQTGRAHAQRPRVLSLYSYIDSPRKGLQRALVSIQSDNHQGFISGN